MNQNSISNSLLNVVLVAAESALTMVLRVDPKLRQTVYPLTKKNAVVAIRSYLPHVEFYATFTPRGILLDSKLPERTHEADVVINAFSHQLLSTLVSNDAEQVQKLTMRGATDTVLEVRHFLNQLGVASLIQGIIKTIKGEKPADATAKKPKDSKEPNYKIITQEQKAELTKLSMLTRELEVSLQEQQSKQKTTLYAFIIASLVAIISTIGWMN